MSNRPLSNQAHSWNKGKLIGQKSSLKAQQVWAIRTRLQINDNKRDLALLNLAIDSKLRGCDLLNLKVSDLFSGGVIQHRAKIIQKKTGNAVQFEISAPARDAMCDWISHASLAYHDWIFPSRKNISLKMTTRQYGRIVKSWVISIGLSKSAFGTHSLRRTKATIIYRKTGNLRAVQLLLGHEKIDSTVKYLGVEVEDALALSENIEV